MIVSRCFVIKGRDSNERQVNRERWRGSKFRRVSLCGIGSRREDLEFEEVREIIRLRTDKDCKKIRESDQHSVTKSSELEQ